MDLAVFRPFQMKQASGHQGALRTLSFFWYSDSSKCVCSNKWHSVHRLNYKQDDDRFWGQILECSRTCVINILTRYQKKNYENRQIAWWRSNRSKRCVFSLKPFLLLKAVYRSFSFLVCWTLVWSSPWRICCLCRYARDLLFMEKNINWTLFHQLSPIQNIF